MAGFAFVFIDGTLEDVERTVMNGGADVMVGVRDLEEACAEAARLADSGMSCIELCGAFGPDGARRVIEVTGHRVAVGYVIHDSDMDDLYAKAFGGVDNEP